MICLPLIVQYSSNPSMFFFFIYCKNQLGLSNSAESEFTKLIILLIGMGQDIFSRFGKNRQDCLLSQLGTRYDIWEIKNRSSIYPLTRFKKNEESYFVQCVRDVKFWYSLLA